MVVTKGIARDVFRLFVWYPLRWLARIIPIPWFFIVVKAMGDIHYFVSKQRKKELSANIAMAFPSKSQSELNGIVRQYFENHYCDRLWIFLIPRLRLNNIERYHKIEGAENLEQALKGNNGVILLHGHYCISQFPILHLGLLGYNVCQIGLLIDEGLSYIGRNVAFKWRARLEKMIPAKIINAGSFLRLPFEVLKANGIVMTAGDGAGGNKFIGKFDRVKFLGHDLLFSLGPFILSQKTNAPILPLFTSKEKEYNCYKSVIGVPLDLDEGIEDFSRLYEDIITRYPYYWHFWDEFTEGKRIIV